jgi:hypothetical protein
MANSEDIKKESQKKLALQKRYGQRITIMRQGREAFLAKDYVNATKKYLEYLAILAESKDLDDVFKLSPTMFDKSTQVTELLVISHVYWELARIYEMTPKLQNNFNKALNQFIKFSVNQPYQVFNSEMLRKYIKKNKNKSIQIGQLNNALSQILIQSRKCFIATEIFGESHKTTNQLRLFKLELLAWPFGEQLVNIYYRLSTNLLDYKDSYFVQLFFSALKYPLVFFALFSQSSIFKKCSYFLKSLLKNGSNP